MYQSQTAILQSLGAVLSQGKMQNFESWRNQRNFAERYLFRFNTTFQYTRRPLSICVNATHLVNNVTNDHFYL